MLVKQLNNIAQEVGKKKCKNALIQMFSIKTIGCNCLLKVDPLSPHVPNHSMSDGDFFIRYEHKFLRNIDTKKLLNRLKFVLLNKIL